MHRFTTEYPQINLDISVNAEAGDIVGNHFDAGIHPAESLAQDMIAVPNRDLARRLMASRCRESVAGVKPGTRRSVSSRTRPPPCAIVVVEAFDRDQTCHAELIKALHEIEPKWNN
jgi:hypothetical protein